ncbi:MAG: hypothetical protein R3255_07875 [Candidatus Lokiarchaeia archaeon]|nr:hypothetical protein [Candidatus Lokiarchaeia archaeon]
MEPINDKKKSEKKQVSYSSLGYCCCVVLVTLIALSIIFWYITIPLIGILIIIYLIFRHQNKKKLYITLDTTIKQEEFSKESGYLPLEKGKFTKKYKVWLIQKENEKKIVLPLQPTLISPNPYQPVYQKENNLNKNAIIQELHVLKAKILELPKNFPTSTFTFGTGITQAKEQVPIICSNIDDAINALKNGKDSYNHPITEYQIADGLSNLINATRRPEFIGLITSVLNNNGINEFKKNMNELEQIVLNIRSIPSETIIQPPSIPPSQDIIQQQPVSQPHNITHPKPIPPTQLIPPPVYGQKNEIEKLIQIDSKDFKVKFRDYTPTEKTIRVITESITMALLIFFAIFMIWSGINKLYINIVISIIIIVIYLIPHEMLEKRLRNRVRIRKQKALVAKYVKLQNASSIPSYQSKPVYHPAQSQEPDKIFCHHCGFENLKTFKFCKNCGHKIE